MGDLTAAEKEILASGHVSQIGLVRVATVPPVRLATGAGDFPLVRNAFDADGVVYTGNGRLLTMPAVKQLINVTAEEIPLSLSGVTPDLRDLFATEAPAAIGAEVRVGWVILGPSWEQVGPVRWVRRATIVKATAENTASGGKRSRTLSVVCSTLAAGRRVAGYGTWTSQDQQSRAGSEDDRACERVPLYTRQTEKAWP